MNQRIIIAMGLVLAPVALQVALERVETIAR